MTNRPEAAIWIDIPEDCHISGEFTGDRDIQIAFGGSNDSVGVVFERLALERFAQLVNELLAVPLPDDLKVDLPKLQAPGI
jgi:hypothetical protein